MLHDLVRLRTSILRAAGPLTLAMSLAGCAAHTPTVNGDTSRAIEAYRQGLVEATKEIRAGAPTIYTFGLNTPAGRDPETGLPYKRVGSDAIGDELLWNVLGHNDTVKAYRGVQLGAVSP